MKALIYKEMRLAMHPVCYVFVFFFPFMVLIPTYPLAVGFIYILSCYPILFLGANKGQQSNDLLYSVLLPIRKKDIVKARIFTVLIIQVTYMLLMSALVPLSHLIQDQIVQSGGKFVPNIGFSLDGYVSVLAFGVVAFAIADLIYFSIYYKNGRSILLSTLLMIFGFILFLLTFTVAIPVIEPFKPYKEFFCDSGLGIQFAALGIAVAISIGLHFLTYRIASKELELVDF